MTQMPGKVLRAVTNQYTERRDIGAMRRTDRRITSQCMLQRWSTLLRMWQLLALSLPEEKRLPVQAYLASEPNILQGVRSIAYTQKTYSQIFISPTPLNSFLRAGWASEIRTCLCYRAPRPFQTLYTTVAVSRAPGLIGRRR